MQYEKMLKKQVVQLRSQTVILFPVFRKWQYLERSHLVMKSGLGLGMSLIFHLAITSVKVIVCHRTAARTRAFGMKSSIVGRDNDFVMARVSFFPVVTKVLLSVSIWRFFQCENPIS